jgi:hypothetical protein
VCHLPGVPSIVNLLPITVHYTLANVHGIIYVPCYQKRTIHTVELDIKQLYVIKSIRCSNATRIYIYVYVLRNIQAYTNNIYTGINRT